MDGHSASGPQLLHPERTVRVRCSQTPNQQNDSSYLLLPGLTECREISWTSADLISALLATHARGGRGHHRRSWVLGELLGHLLSHIFLRWHSAYLGCSIRETHRPVHAPGSALLAAFLTGSRSELSASRSLTGLQQNYP